MQTNYKTTYILLERGTEDVALLDEVNRAFAIIAQGTKDAATRFPKLLELAQGLRDEVNREG